jgi:hypothetical protein
MGNEDDSIPLADTSRSRQESELTLTSGMSTPGLRDQINREHKTRHVSEAPAVRQRMITTQ